MELNLPFDGSGSVAEAPRDPAALGSGAVFARCLISLFQAILRFCDALSLVLLANQRNAAARWETMRLYVAAFVSWQAAKLPTRPMAPLAAAHPRALGYSVPHRSRRCQAVRVRIARVSPITDERDPTPAANPARWGHQEVVPHVTDGWQACPPR
jgi:hypothetical protein